MPSEMTHSGETYLGSTRMDQKNDKGEVECCIDFASDGFGGDDTSNFFVVGEAVECDYDVAISSSAVSLTLTKENMVVLRDALDKAIKEAS